MDIDNWNVVVAISNHIIKNSNATDLPATV
jgi:hypothetical protein